MGRAKIKKKSTFIDMTAMSDVTVLLLTFFMLTSTFVKKEPVQVTTPASVSEIKIPEKNILSILVDPDGKIFMSMDKQSDLKAVLEKMGEEWKSRFAGKPINKVVTIEASGIGIACIVAKYFGTPVVFAKKSKSINIDGDMYVAEVESFTHKCKNQVIVSKKFLSPDDHVLIIDDFLANGCALQGLISIVNSAGATVEGIGVAIEKGFQIGGQTIRNLGYQLESLAIVDAMDAETGSITFREQ